MMRQGAVALLVGLTTGVFVAGLLAAGSARAADAFTPPRWGLTVLAPSGWDHAEPQPFVALFTPPADLPGGGAITIGLRNLHAPEAATIERLASRLTSELRTQAEAATIHQEKPFRWDIGRGVVMGRQVVADFTREGVALRQWTVFVPSPLGPVLHMWQFTAPQGIFATHLPVAQRMLDSLRPTEPAREE